MLAKMAVMRATTSMTPTSANMALLWPWAVMRLGWPAGAAPEPWLGGLMLRLAWRRARMVLGASCAPGICGVLRCCGGQGPDLLVVDSSVLWHKSEDLCTLFCWCSFVLKCAGFPPVTILCSTGSTHRTFCQHLVDHPGETMHPA